MPSGCIADNLIGAGDLPHILADDDKAIVQFAGAYSSFNVLTRTPTL